MPRANCEFRGVGGEYFSTVIIHLFLLGIATLGIYSPWAFVRLFRLKASHTTIDGKAVTFSGAGMELLGLILINGLLTVITFGLYGPWAICKILSWKAQNTLVGGKPSRFTATGGSLFLFYLIHLMILPILTLGIYYLFGLYRFCAWKEEHTKYGGEKTSFGAGFGGFLGVSLLGWVLNTITFTLFTPWAICMLYRWEVHGLAVGDHKGVEHFPPVKTNPAVVAVLVAVGLCPLLALGLYVRDQYAVYLKGTGQLSQVTKVTRKDLGRKVIRDSPLKRGAPVGAPRRGKRPISREETALRTGPKEGKRGGGAADYAREIKALDRVIMRDGKDPDAFYNRAWLYEREGDLERAIEDYSRAIQINDKDGGAYYNRGLLYVREGNYLKALRDFSKAIELDPNSADAYCNRGNVNHHLGSNALAIEDYTKAIKIRPDDPDLYYNRGVVYMAKGEDQKGMADLRRAARMGHEGAKGYLK